MSYGQDVAKLRRNVDAVDATSLICNVASNPARRGKKNPLVFGLIAKIQTIQFAKSKLNKIVVHLCDFQKLNRNRKLLKGRVYQ